jgi:TetR/AcrR family transcriptional repressor of bet genes
MPRSVDHTARRRQITDAARHVVVRGGLDGATFQAVAAEAGISVRLVQYYFGTKAGLLTETHRAVIEDSAARFAPAVPGPGEGASADAADGDPTAPAPRGLLRAVLTALLPLDGPRRDDAVVLAAFHAAALAHQDVEPDRLAGAPRALVDVLAALLADADTGPRGSGDAGPGDPAGSVLDAEILLAAAAGLTQGLLAGHHTPDSALAVVDRLLDRLAPEAPQPRRHPGPKPEAR